LLDLRDADLGENDVIESRVEIYRGNSKRDSPNVPYEDRHDIVG